MQFRKKQVPWNKGKILSQEHKDKLAAAHRGKTLSVEHRNSIGRSLEGRKRPQEVIEKVASSNRGKKRSDSARAKMRRAQLGKRASIETRRKQSDAHKGCKAPAWKGGVTPLNRLIRTSLEYKLWRVSVFERDDYTCVFCKVRGGNLHADHIKPFAHYPELRFAIDNGRTLCVSCHRKTDTYGYKSKNK